MQARSVLLSALLTVILHQAATERYVRYYKVPFFEYPSMTCDHPDLDIAGKNNIRAISWVFPDGSIVKAPEDVDPKKYAFSGPTTTASLDLYNLTALKISDDQFGYYHCVVEFTTAQSAEIIRWGLNVDGADFSELLEEYRDKAKIGGYAAAAVLVLVGGSCLFWNYRYSDNNTDGSADTDGVEATKPTSVVEAEYPSKQDSNGTKFDNAAYTPDDDTPAVVVVEKL